MEGLSARLMEVVRNINSYKALAKKSINLLVYYILMSSTFSQVEQMPLAEFIMHGRHLLRQLEDEVPQFHALFARKWGRFSALHSPGPRSWDIFAFYWLDIHLRGIKTLEEFQFGV